MNSQTFKIHLRVYFFILIGNLRVVALENYVLAIIIAIISFGISVYLAIITIVFENQKRRKERLLALAYMTTTNVQNTEVANFIELRLQHAKYEKELEQLTTSVLKKAFKSEQNRISELLEKETDSEKRMDYSAALSTLKSGKPASWFEKNRIVTVSLITSLLGVLVTSAVIFLSIYLST